MYVKTQCHNLFRSGNTSKFTPRLDCVLIKEMSDFGGLRLLSNSSAYQSKLFSEDSMAIYNNHFKAFNAMGQNY